MDAAPPLTPDRVLRRLEWRVIRRLDGRLQGDYRTLVRGQGTDFRDLREYEAGDDVRHVDWNVTARMDALYVREFTEDRELTAWLLLDRSPSMGFGPVDRTKQALLRDFTTTVARLLIRNGNRVGALVYDNDVSRTIPPRQGRDQVLLLLHDLLQPVDANGQVTDLRRLLERAARVIRRRSLIVLVSDFITEPGWEKPLARLNERHEVVAVRLFDPREYDLPDAGLIAVQDAETGEQLLVDSSDPEFRRRLRRAGEDQAIAVRDAARAAGVDLHVISTDDDLVDAFVRIVESRRRLRRR
ncbi:MAG: DUF58 domain-containing protein [Acidimicrobiia bacterium]|nr:DUF58 domain-containing protein [Acidimicrobiia bacterium]MBV9043134.1 DUF58 domain-containing protein [Acidimicrobiia bacterium]